MNDKSDIDSKLGHDPLDWLKDDNAVIKQEGPNTSTKDTDAPEVGPATSPDDSQSNELEKLNIEAEFSKQEQGDSLLFDGGLTVAKMEALKPNVLAAVEALPEGADWAIDLSHVTQIDSSGYQLMISTLNSCNLKQISVTLLGLNKEVKNQLELLGDERLLAILEAA